METGSGQSTVRAHILDICEYIKNCDKLQHFQSFDGIENKLDYVYSEVLQNKLLSNIADLWDKPSLSKDNKIALQKRNEGNVAFQNGQFEDALKLYNESILSAACPAHLESENDFAEFAMGLANRAAVMAKFKMYNSVIQDLELALKSGYPKHLTYKAFQRLAVAYEGIQEYENAIKAQKNIIIALNFSEVPNEKIKKMINDVKRSIKVSEMSGKLNENLKNKDVDYFVPKVHPEIGTFSEAMKQENNEEEGRFVTAGREIQVGEVLAREEAFQVAVRAIKLQSHCTHCLKQTANPLPCPTCRGVVFCSLPCHQQGLQYHRWECWMSLIDLFNKDANRGSNAVIQSLISYRAISKQPAEFHLCNLERWKSEDIDEDLPNQANLTSDQIKYRRFYKLVAHLEDLDYLELVSTGTFFLLCLEKSGYFPVCMTHSKKVRVGSLLCRNHAAVQSNNHAVFELVGDDKEPLRKEMVGLGVFPDIATYFNHSCDPNTFVVDVGSDQVTLASRTIRLGERVSTIYLGHYGDTKREERRERLQREFHFYCQCSACVGDFPMAEVCLERGISIKDATPDMLRNNVTREDLDKAEAANQLFGRAVEESLDKGRVGDALKAYIERVKIISEYLLPPHILHLMGRGALVDCLWYLIGNRSFRHKPAKLQCYF